MAYCLTEFHIFCLILTNYQLCAYLLRRHKNIWNEDILSGTQIQTCSANEYIKTRLSHCIAYLEKE